MKLTLMLALLAAGPAFAEEAAPPAPPPAPPPAAEIAPRAVEAAPAHLNDLAKGAFRVGLGLFGGGGATTFGSSISPILNLGIFLTNTLALDLNASLIAVAGAGGAAGGFTLEPGLLFYFRTEHRLVTYARIAASVSAGTVPIRQTQARVPSAAGILGGLGVECFLLPELSVSGESGVGVGVLLEGGTGVLLTTLRTGVGLNFYF